jgi:hypothetical protein
MDPFGTTVWGRVTGRLSAQARAVGEVRHPLHPKGPLELKLGRPLMEGWSLLALLKAVLLFRVFLTWSKGVVKRG